MQIFVKKNRKFFNALKKNEININFLCAIIIVCSSLA